MTRWFRLLLLLVVMGAAPVDSVRACVGCRSVSEEVGQKEPETIQAGIALSWSVLFMLAVVGGVLSFLGVYVTRTVARLERERES